MLRLCIFIALALLCCTWAAPAKSAVSVEPKTVFTLLLKLIGDKDADIDADSCFKDLPATETAFAAFSTDMSSKQYTAAITDLQLALATLETSISNCQVRPHTNLMQVPPSHCSLTPLHPTPLPHSRSRRSRLRSLPLPLL